MLIPFQTLDGQIYAVVVPFQAFPLCSGDRFIFGGYFVENKSAVCGHVLLSVGSWFHSEEHFAPKSKIRWLVVVIM